MADIECTCKDCGAKFMFTEGEQKFYAERNFSSPTRCPECRKANKAKKQNDRPNFNKRSY